MLCVHICIFNGILALHFFVRALEISCNNANWPDTHGHYREAQFTQTKHHWWWKANWIFDKVSTTKYFTGENLDNQLAQN